MEIEKNHIFLFVLFVNNCVEKGRDMNVCACVVESVHVFVSAHNICGIN